MVAEKYCQIVERDTAEVSGIWKATHIACLWVAAISSFAAVLLFYGVETAFGERCIIFANLTFADENELIYETVGDLGDHFMSFHNSKTFWGPAQGCSYVMGAFLLSLVVALIMLAFFIIVPKGGFSAESYFYAYSWKIVPPAIMLAALMSLTTGIAFYIYSRGTDSFIAQIVDQLREQGVCETKCDDEVNKFTLIFHTEVIDATRKIDAMMKFSEVALMSWLLCTAFLVIRMFLGIDFKIIVYHIRAVHEGSSQSSGSLPPERKMRQLQKRRASEVARHKDSDAESIASSSTSSDDDDDDDDLEIANVFL